MVVASWTISDTTGGATLTFEICDGHPLARDVLGLLDRTRTQANELWHKVEDHNGRHPIAEEDIRRVTFYFGQFVKSSEDEP